MASKLCSTFVFMTVVSVAFNTPLAYSIEPLPEETRKAAEARYAPREIIVKFKPEVGMKIAQRLTDDLTLPNASTSTESIDALNRKFKVKEISPVFKGIHRKMKATGKDAITLQKETAEKFPERAKRVPKGTSPTTGLENVYLLKTEVEVNVQEMISEYSRDPNVEYAEPNYIATAQNEENLPKQLG